MKRYKLTSQDRTTHNGFQLPADGEWFEAEDMISPPRECTNTVLHHYAHPLLAVLLNPIHGNYENPLLFEIEIDEEIGTDGLKAWCRRQRIVREIPLPKITTEQRVEFAIRVAKVVYEDQQWLIWADKWLSGEDRSVKAAWAVWSARVAVWAARVAVEAAMWAARAAEAEAVKMAVDAESKAAVWAARVAREAARAAREAARAAEAARTAATARGIDVVSIIEQIVNRKEGE